ncbi:hypothetical protein [Streptomyces prasinopilosus]|uniref:Nucleotidyltransferase n=1 Tax=Streptomyces prasinopilosus TaxID=67344 RepID=A0A1G6ZZK2_9ACTN|nr:hypothetical protein [Streptomyces prasinopilosus]SDE07803.1 hypothetical protein SAMN05216505_116102 [Streptomyces prasinopilosus]
MAHLHKQFDDLLTLINVDPDVLTATRERLALARKLAEQHPEGRTSYSSGSIPMGTHIQPHAGAVSDGDGGIILDRVRHPELGPDGRWEAPHAVTDELVAFIGPRLRDPERTPSYPQARVCKSRRGLKIHFGAPVNGTDVTVDLILALRRREGRGLWIPDLKRAPGSKKAWSASDPQGHVELLTSGADALRRTRRRAIRILKAWNAQATKPGFSSHQLSVWAHEFVEPGMGLVGAVHTVLLEAALRLQHGEPTKDPRCVSADLKPLIPETDAERRLRVAADKLAKAIAAPDDIDTVAEVLENLFPKTMRERERAFSATSAPLSSTASLGFKGASLLLPKTRSWREDTAVER